MIRGIFPPLSSPHAHLVVGMNLPELDVDWLPVPFLVDTGATSTCIHPNDAVGLLKIPPARLDPANWDNGRIREAFGISGVVRFLETEAYF